MMENTNENRNFDQNALEFLESVIPDGGPKNFSPEILQQASALNIDLDDLETVGTPGGLAVISQNETAAPGLQDNIPVQDFIEGTDIHLKDVIDKVFNNSERCFVVVRDDKIEYANRTFLKAIGVPGEDDVRGKNFLSFVAREDWTLLAENIGEMLLNGKSMIVRLKMSDSQLLRMTFDAFYVPDNQHFTFILVGDRMAQKNNPVAGLYDSVTSLPNFYLFEDRVQMAVNFENYKDDGLPKNKIAVIAVAIDNFEGLKSIGMHELILRKIAEKLAMSLKKTYTAASGLKYHFWILIPGVPDMKTLETEIEKVKEILTEPVADNFTEHAVIASLGVSIFPDPASSAKKLIEQAILSVQKAQRDGGNRLVLFGA